MNTTVGQARDLKAECEEAIYQALQKFIEQTGMRVDNVRLAGDRAMGYRQGWTTVVIDASL